MHDRIEAALRGSQADYTEIRVETTDRTAIQFRGPELEEVSAVINTGGIVRCLIRNTGWGIATFNNLEDLPGKVVQAYDCARVGAVETPIELAPIPVTQDRVYATLPDDFRGHSLDEKKRLIEGYNRILLDYDPKVIDTIAVYADEFSHITFANSEGTYIEEERPTVGVQAFALSRDGNNVQQTWESRAGPHGFDFVQGLEPLVETVARRAVALLSAESVPGGTYPVVVNPLLAGVFVHEAFGHLSEADFIYENPRAREMMELGRRFGRDWLTIYDDGSVPNARGTHKYDDEGTPTGRSDLIKDGILVGRLHSRETAAKMGEAATGNARALSYRHAPIVRMTNTAIERGTTSFEEMIGDIDLGIYACDAYGGQTELETFSFSAGYAYMIRNGQVAEMVKDVILAGNLFTTLMNIDAVGDDFSWAKVGGGCGKGGQNGLSVAMGAPHIRIQNVVIGGK